MSNVTDLFVEYLFTKSRTISEKAVEKARQCRMDYTAVTVAGAAKNQEKWKKLSDILPAGKARLFGYEQSTDSRSAALINGFNAHSLELDDGQRFAMIHLGAAILSALEAACDDFNFCDEAFLTGIIMGYETACRLSIAMQPSHKRRGYHTAGTCGTIGAAIGVGFALRMDPIQLKRVLTLAADSAAGMLEMQEQQSEVKPYNLGRAAMDGLNAAYMGLTEFEIPEDLLGGDRGFFRIFSDQWDTRKLTDNHAFFEIERIYVKPYASCRHSHSAIEAALLVRKKVEINKIDRVEVETYRLGVQGHDHTDIESVASAKLSTPYAVAVALLYGRADLSAFEPLDVTAVRFAKKVSVHENAELTELCPNKRAAIVHVEMKDGSCETERIEYAKGEPENPMSSAELQEKWNALSQYAGEIIKKN